MHNDIASNLIVALTASILMLTAGPATADGGDTPTLLHAEALAQFDAPEADQGVVATGSFVYVIDNKRIGRFKKNSYRRDGRVTLSRGGIKHLNSCALGGDDEHLWCANSNFPERPMASSVEVFARDTLRHVESYSLGITDGSLVWFHPSEDGYLAGFAHYDGNGGIEGKSHRWTRIVRLDADLQRRAGWMLPDSVLKRLAPSSASGGAVGPDGLLYITGHDRPEMYVLGKPERGPKLIHLATVEIAIHGQAFAWDPAQERVVWGVDRPSSTVRSFRIPSIPRSDAYRFE